MGNQITKSFSSLKTKALNRIDKKKVGLKGGLLVFFLLIGIIPVSVSSTITYYGEKAQAIADWEDRLGAIGRQKTHHIETWFEERKGDTTFLAKSHTVHELTEDLTDGIPSGNEEENLAKMELTFQNMIHEYGCYNEIFILDLDGKIQVQQSKLGWEFGHVVNSSQSKKEYMINCVTNEKVEDYCFLSDFRRSGTGEYIQITTSAPIHNHDGELVGVLVIFIDATFIDQLMANTEGLLTSGETYLVNHNRYWLTASKFNSTISGEGWYCTPDGGSYSSTEDIILVEQVNTDGIAEALLSETMVYTPSNLDYQGEAVIGSYHYLEINDQDQPWVLVAEINVDEALSGIDALLISTLIIVFSAIGLIGVFSVIIGSAIANPVKKIADISQTIADGDYDVSLKDPFL